MALKLAGPPPPSQGRFTRKTRTRVSQDYLPRIEIAIGRIGDAVAPLIFSGDAMNRNSYTWSFARSSSYTASNIDTPCSASKYVCTGTKFSGSFEGKLSTPKLSAPNSMAFCDSTSH